MKAKKGTLIHIVGKLTSHMYQERRMWEIRAREWKVVADGRQTEAQPNKLLGPEPSGPWRTEPKSAWGN